MYLSLQSAKGCFVGIGDVQKSVGVSALLVYVVHERVSLQQEPPVDEEIERRGLWQLDSLSDNVVEVVCGKIVWDQVFGLVDVWQF